MQTIARIAQPGDLCILLEPAPDGEQRLYAQQTALLARYGGQIMLPVHLTCQRIELAQERLPELRECLRELRSAAQNVTLSAVTLQSQYSPYRDLHVLKWVIAVSAELRCFTANLEAALDAVGATSLYGRGFQSTWVTALEGICARHDDAPLARYDPPLSLFTARQLALTRIRGPFEFETLERYTLT